MARDGAPLLPGAGAWLSALAVVVALQQAFGLVVRPFSPSVPLFCAAFAGVAASVIGVGRFAPSVGRRGAILVILPVVGILAIALESPAEGSALFAGLTTLCLLFGGSLLGAALGREIVDPGHLLPLAYVSALADVFSVLSPEGPSATVVADERLLALVAVPWPIGGGIHAPILGIGDVIMTTLYLVAIRAHDLSQRRAVSVLGLSYGLLLLLLLLIERAIPALPILGLGVVAAFPEARRLRPEDRMKALVGMAALTAVVALAMLRA